MWKKNNGCHLGMVGRGNQLSLFSPVHSQALSVCYCVCIQYAVRCFIPRELAFLSTIRIMIPLESNCPSPFMLLQHLSTGH